MKKIIILLLLNCFISALLLSDNINKYNIALVKIISTGSEEGSIGWEDMSYGSGGYNQPRTFLIKNHKIYIPDLVNKRINIYDLNFNFLKSIVEPGKKKCHFASKLDIDNNENLYCLLDYKGLRKIDQNGVVLYTLDGNSLPDNLTVKQNFFILKNELYFYNDKNEVEKLSNDGIIKSKDIAIKELKHIGKDRIKERKQYMKTITNDKKEFTEEQLNKISKKIDAYKNILIVDKLYTTDIQHTKRYYQKIKEIVPEKSKLTKISSKNDVKNFQIESEQYHWNFIGFDQDHNGYWKVDEKNEIKGIKRQLIVIYSKFGDILEMFQYGELFKSHYNTELYETSGSIPATTLNGDVYFMQGGSKYYKFYKVTRQW